MPAWKDELTDQQIWTLTLFLKHMDNLPSAVKAAWQKSDQQNHGLEFESPAGSVTHPSSDH
jgi:hypothetical protein